MELLVHLDRLELPRGLDWRAPLGRLRDHRLPGDVHRRRRRAHAPHPPRHRRGVAALPQPVHRRRAPDAARLHDARAGHVRRRARLARLRRGQDGAQARGPAAQARRVARRHHGADAGPHGHQEDRLVRPRRGAPAAQELLAADDGDGGRVVAARRPARWRPASTASACCRSAAPRTTRSRRTPATGASTRTRPAPTARRRTARKWRIVTFAHVAETRRAGAPRHGLRARGLRPLFRGSGDLPDHPARRDGRPGGVPCRIGARLHRHARTTASAISSGCGRDRTAASAACCCWRTTGPTGRRH